MLEAHIGDRVKLREGFGDVYLFAPVEATGSIVDRKIDDYGHALVWIRWDRGSHRESDGWTYASHFEVVAQDNHTIAQFTNKSEIRRLKEEKDKKEKEEEYMQFLTKAIDLAADSEGFFMVTVKKSEEGEYVPYGFAMAQTTAAGILLEAQIVQMASEALQHAASRALNYLNEDEDE